jgi:hypothetical protein
MDSNQEFYQNLCMSFTKSLEYSIFLLNLLIFLFYCKNIKSKSNYDFEAIFVLWLQF